MKTNSSRKTENREAWILVKKAAAYWWRAESKAFISTTVSAFVTAVSPCVFIYFSAQLINEIAHGRRLNEMIRFAVIVLTAAAGLSLLEAALKRWKNAVHDPLWLINRKQVLDKFLSMDYCDADNPETHKLLAYMRQGEQWIHSGLLKIQEMYEDMINAVFKLIGACALSATLFTSTVTRDSLRFLNSPLCLAAVLIIMVVITIAAPALNAKGDEYFYARGAEDIMKSNRVYMTYGCMAIKERERGEDIRIYRQEAFCSSKQDVGFIISPESNFGRWARGPMGLLYAAGAAVSRVFTGAAYLFVCLKAWGGAFGVGSVTQYISAITALSSGVSQILLTCSQIKAQKPFLENTFTLLDMPNNMYQGSLTVEKRRDRKYDVEFRNVSFRYPGSEAWALKNLSLKFTVGERLAVVGENGSGKTTMIKLLCRLYDPTEGEILLNGINIRKYNYREYMSIFSVVFQDFQLLAFTLGQNVAAGSRYDAQKAEQCLEEAGFDHRLSTMPQGMETYLYKDFDNSGVEISGGEGQKIAIARALYKNAPFIVLDEPTAALDPIAEAEIYARFNTLIEDRTAVYISHRLSSCRFCDRIAVFDKGSIVQFGTHEELLTDGDGKYSQLWHAQAQYYVSSGLFHE